MPVSRKSFHKWETESRLGRLAGVFSLHRSSYYSVMFDDKYHNNYIVIPSSLLLLLTTTTTTN